MATDVLQDSFSGSISDVFGNDLGDVDIWGDNEESFDPRPTTNDQSWMLVDRTLKIAESKVAAALTLPPMSPQKPPRTPSGREGIHKTMAIKPPMSRSSGSDGSLRDLVKPVSEVSNAKALPHMMSRTRMRRLQASKPRIVSPPPPDEDSPLKPISVAEKRRLRHEALFSRANSFDQTESDESFPKLGSQAFETSSNHTGATAPFDSSCSSFSFSTSNLSSSFAHDMGHSFDSKDMSHSSIGSSFRRRMASTSNVSPDETEPRGNSVDDLQKHIETVLTECQEERRRDVSPSPRSSSSPRTSRGFRKCASEQRSSARDGSVPRAGGKVKFVRGSDKESDDNSRTSSRSKATRTTKGSRSSQPSRSSSMAIVHSRPKKGLSESKPPRTRSASSAKRSSSASQVMMSRKLESPPSPARRRGSGSEGACTRSSSGTPRRKIKYVKNADVSQNQAISAISTLEF